MHFRFGDDLEQRDPGAVKIDQGAGIALLIGGMGQFACVFFHVNAGDVDDAFSGRRIDGERTAQAEGVFVLGDLVALG